MTPTLKISEKIVNRLSNNWNDSNTTGKIYGVLAKSSLVVLGIQLDTENSSGNALINSFPAEIYVCGIINISSEAFDQQSTKTRLSDVYVTDNPVFLNYNYEQKQITAYYYLSGQLEKTAFATVSEQEIFADFLYLRLQASVPLSCELSPESIKDAFLEQRKSIASGIMTFGFENNSIYLVGNDNENGIVGIGGNPGVGDVWDEGNAQTEGNNKKKKPPMYELDVLNVNMLKKITIDANLSNTTDKPHAPLCVLNKKHTKSLSFNLTIDSLSVVHRRTEIASLYEILVESAIRYLRLLETAFLDGFERLGGDFSKPETYHFYPTNCTHFMTRIYFINERDEDLRSEREKLHKELLLDVTHPYFRRANNYRFKAAKNGENSPLINPHEAVRATDNGGRISLVKGKYAYYHYCQDGMDDNGWGCAYRSLQTLASWFNLQGYTDKQVPRFKDIQTCLVDIGDKEKNFIDSKQWIGSTEVNFVLNSLLGVTSKILYVSSGEEMASKGPELANHFETHGSPVMIGGGVLAHTILGVDYNPKSGSLKFLILDPHYTGGENLHTIQTKGWCGWKGVDFWDKTAYYNMCLPLVPILI